MQQILNQSNSKVVTTMPSSLLKQIGFCLVRVGGHQHDYIIMAHASTVALNGGKSTNRVRRHERLASVRVTERGRGKQVEGGGSKENHQRNGK